MSDTSYEEKTEIVFDTWDLNHRGRFTTLKEARADYKKAKEEWGMAMLLGTKTKVMTVEITEVLQELV